MNQVDYASGISVLKTIHADMKTNLSLTQFMTGLQMTHYGEKIPLNEFNEWVANIGYTKKTFLAIPWKSNSDFSDILKSIASKIPYGKVPTRMMITDAFLNPKTFKASVLDIAGMTIKETTSAAKKVTTTVVGVADFLTKYKGPLLILAGGIVALKLFQHSDKIKTAYNRVTSDAGKAYGRVHSDYKNRKK